MHQKPIIQDETLRAYIIGLAIGDGNLSNPNGRATRLRISCNTNYPNLIDTIIKSLKLLFPLSKVSIIKRKAACVDISIFSNHLESLLGWKVDKGSKCDQAVKIPAWIMNTANYKINCLRGLIQTDGSIYNDRGYKMVNFVTVIPELAHQVNSIIQDLGFKSHLYRLKTTHKDRYNIRVSKNVTEFIKILDLVKD